MLVAFLIGISCLVRFSLALFGYVKPLLLMKQLGAEQIKNVQMPYVIRVRAIRDIVISVLIAIARDHVQNSAPIDFIEARKLRSTTA